MVAIVIITCAAMQPIWSETAGKRVATGQCHVNACDSNGNLGVNTEVSAFPGGNSGRWPGYRSEDLIVVVDGNHMLAKPESEI